MQKKTVIVYPYKKNRRSKISPSLVMVKGRNCAFNQCLVKVIRNLLEKANQWKLYVISCYSTCFFETVPSSHCRKLGNEKKTLKMKIAILFLVLNNSKVKFTELKNSELILVSAVQYSYVSDCHSAGHMAKVKQLN